MCLPGLPPEDRDVIRQNYTPPLPVSFDGKVCSRCGGQAAKWMMASADESPTYLCGLWPRCATVVPDTGTCIDCGKTVLIGD